MKEIINKIGVSPAYLISAYGTKFTPDNVVNAIDILTFTGFSNLQIEIFSEDRIPLWLDDGGGKKVNQTILRKDFIVNQLVCHLLIEEFTSYKAFSNLNGIKIFKKMIEICRCIDFCDSLVLPIGTFKDWAFVEKNNLEKENLYLKFLEKFQRFIDIISNTNLKLSIEILPNSIIGNYQTLNHLILELKDHNIGILFDTGHAWANGEDVVNIPNFYGKYIFGTHLCDNFGKESYSFAPGKGNINWEGVLNSLIKSGYSGCYDVEILCDQINVEKEYKFGFEFIKSILSEAISKVILE